MYKAIAYESTPTTIEVEQVEETLQARAELKGVYGFVDCGRVGTYAVRRTKEQAIAALRGYYADMVAKAEKELAVYRAAIDLIDRG